MTRFIVVASGKGGVGKTTTAINLGVALSKLGKDVIVVDGNLTTPNLGLYLGVNKVPLALHDVLKGEKSILNAIYRHESGLKVIPGNISIDALGKLEGKRIKKEFQKLQGASEIVIIDSGAGLNKETLSLLEIADEALVVTTPDIVSVTDALKTIRLAEEKNTTVLGVLINKSKKDDSELNVQNIEAILEKPVIATIPDSDDVRKALIEKYPVVHTAPHSDVARKFNKLAASLAGEEYEEDNWFMRLLR